eukprot:COSAG01_NODE_1945_length_8831_cov_4.250000_3_plen_120_part_00
MGSHKPIDRAKEDAMRDSHARKMKGGRNVGSTASVGNTAHLKKLEQAYTSSLAPSDSRAQVTSNQEVYKSGYGVDMMSSRELMELRRNIDAALDVRGVEPASTYVPACSRTWQQLVKLG